MTREPNQHVAEHASGPRTIFTGVSAEVSRGVQDVGLYEFWTEAGHHVYLHDMDFQWFRYAATSSPELRIRFSWGGRLVPESYAGPVVDFSFGDVRIHQWNEEAFDDRDRAHLGQVGAFGYDNNVFSLQTFGLSLLFTARKCDVATGPDL